MLLPVRWPAPARVQTFASTRRGGVSAAPFHSLNLSTASGDGEAPVAHNVARLVRAAGLPATPCWPRQVHGAGVVEAGELAGGTARGDAVFTTRTNTVCAVRTADCLPVLLCDRAGTTVAAVHAGWRGLAAGVVDQTVRTLPAAPHALLAWLGPGIGPAAYEVGDDVRTAFEDRDPGAGKAFRPSPSGRWFADLYLLARMRLRAAGVHSIHGGGWCTHAEPERFFSYRRDGATGRMAFGIWLAPARSGA
jgi:YfiH family protein